MENYEKYLEYVTIELVKINNDVANETLEKIKDLNKENLKNLFSLVSNVNNICSSRIDSYWVWSKRK